MWWSRKCKHPFESLHVEKIHTMTPDEDREYTRVDYHLWCCACRSPVTLEWIHLTDGVSEFLRAKNKSFKS